jgi:hypothetical protein
MSERTRLREQEGEHHQHGRRIENTMIKSRARGSVRNGLMRNVLDILTTPLVPGGPPYPYLDPFRSHCGPTNMLDELRFGRS